MAPRILLVEDDADTARVVRAYLERDGLEVEVAADGLVGLDAAYGEPSDLVVLDWMLPGLDGLSFLRALRRGKSIPVIMLTARSEDGDRIAGFEAGADDYVIKPFSPRELAARVRAVLRRASASASLAHGEIIKIAGLHLDGDRRAVHDAGRQRRAGPPAPPLPDRRWAPAAGARAPNDGPRSGPARGSGSAGSRQEDRTRSRGSRCFRPR